MIKHILNRKWDKAGFGWYDPAEKLKSYVSVLRAVYFNTISSAGDWDGMAVMKYGKKYAIVPFSQENRYPYRGYRLYTGEIVASMKTQPTLDDLGEIYNTIVS